MAVVFTRVVPSIRQPSTTSVDLSAPVHAEAATFPVLAAGIEARQASFRWKERIVAVRRPRPRLFGSNIAARFIGRTPPSVPRFYLTVAKSYVVSCLLLRRLSLSPRFGNFRLVRFSDVPSIAFIACSRTLDWLSDNVLTGVPPHPQCVEISAWLAPDFVWPRLPRVSSDSGSRIFGEY